MNGTGAAAVTGAVAVVTEGVERGLHLGAQVYASVDGKVVADLGIGHAWAGVPMTSDSMVVWFSMTKPSVAVAVAQQWERGALELDDRVAGAPPRVRAHGKDEITIRHLLTHTAGIRTGDAVTSTAPGTAYWDEVVAGICAIEREPDWVPGAAGRLPPQLRDDPARRDRAPPSTGAASSSTCATRCSSRSAWPTAGWACRPTGSRRTATASAPCTTPRRARRCRSTTSTRPTSSGCASPAVVGAARSGSWRASTEALLGRGALEGHRVLTPQTVEAITARHRVGLYDETFHAPVRLGPRVRGRRLRHGPSRVAARVRPRRRAVGASPSPIPSTASSSRCRPTACAATTTTTSGSTPSPPRCTKISGWPPTGAPGRDKPFPSVELTVATTEE